MDHFLIRGGSRLSGTVEISGSKNAALPIMAACLMTDGINRLHRVPALSDIDAMTRLLVDLGCRVRREAPRKIDIPNHPDLDGAMTIEVIDPTSVDPGDDDARSMRASICMLGPLLARRGKAILAQPGGCSIGERPIDLHLKGLSKLGARFYREDGCIVGEAPDGLRGATVFLCGASGPTVLGTINVMTAATLAEGETRIVGAACEPEVVDTARLLNAMGAKITGAGTSEIVIEGVKQLHAVEHTIIPDRIETGTFMVAAAITGGELRLRGARLDHLVAFVDRLEQAGAKVIQQNGDVLVRAGDRPQSVDYVTWPYPGYPTDLQAQLMALLSTADGKSRVIEHIYPQRFKHATELAKMGAQIDVTGSTAWIDGVNTLVAATVRASDLRASAALLLAAMSASGSSKLERVDHIDRGYEKIEQKLACVGAEIDRCPAKPKLTVSVLGREPETAPTVEPERTDRQIVA